MRWISVKTRLPEDGDPVIVSNGKDVWPCSFINYISGPEFETEKGGTRSDVTHWMPLPAPPAGKEG